MSTSINFIAAPAAAQQTPGKSWDVVVESLRGDTHNTGVTVHTPQDAMQALVARFKEHNTPVKRLGHILAFQQRAVAITKLDPMNNLPMPYSRDDSLTKDFKDPSLLLGVSPAAFFAKYSMLDIHDPAYEGHICLIYLETNKTAVKVVDWIVRTGIQAGIHAAIDASFDAVSGCVM